VRAWRSRRRLVLAAAITLGVGAVAVGLLLAAPGAKVGAAGSVPRAHRPPAPELDGRWLVPPPVRLAAFRGTPVLVNFWASWCVPCREEAPHLARFDRAMKERARLVGVDFQDAKEDALAFVHEFGWRFPSVRDPQGKLASRYGLVGLPTTYVIDADGRIAKALNGAQTFASLVRAVEEVE
jgi:cytochrome c biogenesis protein CcmG/thiol:disulfide interchange protein DsbE